MNATEQWPDQRRWVSEIAQIKDDEVLLRGYPHTEVIGRLTFADTFFLMVRGELPSPQQRQLMNALLCAVPDYGLFKPGTVAARIAVSGNPSMTAGLAVAILSAGQHTLDPMEAGTFIVETFARFQSSGQELDSFAERIVEEAAVTKRRIPGFGHPTFKFVDPRSAALREVAERTGLMGKNVELYEAIHRAFARRPGRASIPINDIGMSAALLVELGFAPEEMTGVLLTSTMPGLIAHIAEELRQNVRIRVVDESLQRYAGPKRRSMSDNER